MLADRRWVRFFRTPKGMLLILLVLLLPIAEPGQRIRLVVSNVAVAVAVAAAIDLVALRIVRESWEFPSGAVLSGLLVAMVLSPYEPRWVPAATAALAMAGKYLLRTRSANIFNPAAFGLVATDLLFHTGQSWWGAVPEVSPLALVALGAAGLFIAERVKKIPLVLVFLGVYFLVFTVFSFLGDPGATAEIFRAPDLHAALFFAFFILTDPPTSPVTYGEQLIGGAIVAVASFAVFVLLGAVDYLLVGVLVGNVWEGWRRSHLLTGRRQDSSVAPAKPA